jgi:hypothetical protein
MSFFLSSFWFVIKLICYADGFGLLAVTSRGSPETSNVLTAIGELKEFLS